mmetsp:Transcript_30820/g.95357  ORF Transcript_30820/g.95357 Transcript_30820/m.95357 type:complete len:126 (-) Transcript_30820:495-872(-)
MDEIEAANKKATGAALSIKNNQVMNPSKSWADNVIFNPDMSVEANRKAFEECFPQLNVLFEHQHWASYIRGSSKLMDMVFTWLKRYIESNLDYKTAQSRFGVQRLSPGLGKQSLHSWQNSPRCVP